MFEDLSQWVTQQAEQDFADLFTGFWVTAAGILFFGICYTLFRFYRGRNKQLTEDTARSLQSRTALGAAFFYALLTAILWGSRAGIVLLALLLLLLVLAYRGILRGSPIGTVLLLAGIWLGVPALAVPDLINAWKDARRIGEFSMSMRLTLCAAADFLLLRILLLELLAVLATGSIVGTYRTLCNPRLPKAEEDHVQVVISEKKSELLKFFAGMILAAVLVFIPLSQTGLAGYLVTGSKDANDRFVAVYQEYRDNPQLTADPQWTEQLYSAYDGLTGVNLRAFNVNVRYVSSRDLTLLRSYSQVSLQQLDAMDTLMDCVLTGDEQRAEIAELYFDFTGDLMIGVLLDALESASASRNVLDSCMALMVDSFRFYTAFLPLWTWGPIIGAVGLLWLAAGLRSRRGRKISFRRIFSQMCERNPMAAGTRMTRVCILVALLGVAVAGLSGMFLTTTSTGDGYGGTVNEAFVTSGADMIRALASPAGSEAAVALPEMVDAQQEALASFLASEDVDEMYLPIHEELSVQAAGLLQTLNTMEIQPGEKIPYELRKVYFAQEEAALRLAIKISILSTTNAFSDML